MVDNHEKANIFAKQEEIDESTANKIYDFIEEVFIGIESKIYSMSKEKEEVKEKLTKREGMMYGMNFLEFYLNQLYKSLVDKSDDFIMKKFSDLGDLINLHPVYMLNILTNVIMKCYPMIPRSKLRVNSENEYMDSVKEVSQTMKKYVLTTFTDTLKKLNEEKAKMAKEKENENIEEKQEFKI